MIGQCTEHRRRRTVLAASLSVAVLTLTGCGAGTQEPEQDQPAAGSPEPYAGPYDRAFADDLDAYAVEEMTLTGEVGTVVSPVAFTIAPADDPDVAPLLVLNFDEDAARPEEGRTVEVVGTIHEAYNVPDAEENLRTPPGPEVLAYYDGRPFFSATSVAETGPEATASPG